MQMRSRDQCCLITSCTRLGRLTQSYHIS